MSAPCSPGASAAAIRALIKRNVPHFKRTAEAALLGEHAEHGARLLVALNHPQFAKVLRDLRICCDLERR